MEGIARPFVSEVPDYEILDGNMCISGSNWSLVMPLRVFEAGMRRARDVVDAHYEKRGAIIPLIRATIKKP